MLGPDDFFWPEGGLAGQAVRDGDGDRDHPRDVTRY